MKTTNFFLKLAFLLIVSISLFTTSCNNNNDDDDNNTIDYVKVLTEYLKANNLDLTDMTTDWVATADVINADLANYYIIDLRKAADFANGHIDGAVNSTLTGVLDAAKNAAGKTIILTCYTGQTAAYAHVALRLSGYSTCKIMKFGMSSWNADFDSWTANVSNQATGHANWSTTNTTKTAVNFSMPTFTSTATTGAEILKERVTYMLEKGFQGVDAAEVLANPTNYFINNYWTEADVNTYGHITGAYRINEDLTLAADGIKKLDPASTVLTYCWTGQTSALVSAYLTVLGFETKSLKFGTNALIHDALQKNKWTASGSFPYVK